MITNAKLIAAGTHLSALHLQAAAPGQPNFTMTPEALAYFLPCPSKWQAGYTAEWAQRHRWPAVLSTCYLTPDMWPIDYVCRPDTYNDTALICHSCKTEGRTNVCNKCGATRKRQTVSRPWAGAASHCRAWTAAQQAASRTVLPNSVFNAAIAATARLRADAAAAEYFAASSTNVLFTATWAPESGSPEIPIATLVSLLPKEGSEFDNSLGAFRSAATIEHNQWLERAHYSRFWMKAALDLKLYNLATGSVRNRYLALLSEKDPPFEVGRRSLATQLLQTGEEDFETGMAIYAQCLANNLWPSHDTADDGAQGWSVVDHQPWLASNSRPSLVATE